MGLPSSSELSLEWYLKNNVQGEDDLDVMSAWKDYTGAGVRLGIIDDGFDYKNKDLKPNYDTSLDYDYGRNDNNAAPVTNDDMHGTAVMGVAGAAAGNGGVVGVAYGADLVGERVDFNKEETPFNLDLAHAITRMADQGVGVANMSLGTGYYFETGKNLDKVVSAIDDATANGRGGLGTVLVMAGGNSREDNDGFEADINGRLFDSRTQIISVGSVDRNGYVSYFSSYGASMLVTAFGTDIASTDRVGTKGFNKGGDIATDLAGTSFSAPLVTGVVALMLQANPHLGWRDVQTILAYSARHTGSPVDGKTLSHAEIHPWAYNGADNWNGGGLHFSEDYGYGLVDAAAAVRLAETWTARSTTKNQKTVTQTVLPDTGTATTIPDHDPTGLTFSADVIKNIDIERVGVQMDFSAFSAQLAVYLEAPDGQEFEIFGGAGLDDPSTYSFEFTSQQIRGMESKGTWTVRVADLYKKYATTVSDITLNFHGAKASKNNVYVYTNEFADAVKDGDHATTLADTNGGHDTLNAAAVTSAVTVNLNKGTGKIDSVTMKISGIENIDGGDGKDHLTGSKVANLLTGGRGADVLTGGKGDDTFIYHVTGDSAAGKLHNVITDFSRGDDINLSAIDAKSGSGNQAFKFIGTHGFDGRAGELDFDLVDNKGKTHDMTLIYADVNGDKHADFEIELSGLHHLAKGDFTL
jgi:subtilisin-like proprotein convertase family protein